MVYPLDDLAQTAGWELSAVHNAVRSKTLLNFTHPALLFDRVLAFGLTGLCGAELFSDYVEMTGLKPVYHAASGLSDLTAGGLGPFDETYFVIMRPEHFKLSPSFSCSRIMFYVEGSSARSFKEDFSDGKNISEFLFPRLVQPLFPPAHPISFPEHQAAH